MRLLCQSPEKGLSLQHEESSGCWGPLYLSGPEEPDFRVLLPDVSPTWIKACRDQSLHHVLLSCPHRAEAWSRHWAGERPVRGLCSGGCLSFFLPVLLLFVAWQGYRGQRAETSRGNWQWVRFPSVITAWPCFLIHPPAQVPFSGLAYTGWQPRWP